MSRARRDAFGAQVAHDFGRRFAAVAVVVARHLADDVRAACTPPASWAAGRASWATGRPARARSCARGTRRRRPAVISTISWRPSARSRPYRPASLNSSSTWFLVSTSTSAMSPTRPPMSGRLAGRLEMRRELGVHPRRVANQVLGDRLAQQRMAAPGREHDLRRGLHQRLEQSLARLVVGHRLAQRDHRDRRERRARACPRRLRTAPAPAAFRSTLRSLSARRASGSSGPPMATTYRSARSRDVLAQHAGADLAGGRVRLDQPRHALRRPQSPSRGRAR